MLSSLTLRNNSEPFLNRIVTCDEKWVLYSNQQWPAQWLDREEAPGALLSQTCTNNGHGRCLVVCCQLAHYSVLNPAQSLYLRSMLSKSMRCTKKYNVCSQHWSTERAQFFSTTTPDRMSHNHCFKSGMNWTRNFCLTHHIHLSSHQQTTTSSTISTIFCKENASTTSWRQKMLSKSLLNPKVWNFLLQK